MSVLVALFVTAAQILIVVAPDLLQAGVFVYFGLWLLDVSRDVFAHWIAGGLVYTLGRLALERYSPQLAYRVHLVLCVVWTLGLTTWVAFDPDLHPIYTVLAAIAGALLGSYANFGSAMTFPLVLEQLCIAGAGRASAWWAQRSSAAPAQRSAPPPRSEPHQQTHRRSQERAHQPPPPSPPPSSSSDAWTVLGVPQHASSEQIRRAYLQLMRQYHPDRVASLGPELRALAELKAKEINRAYELLRGRR